MIKELEDVCKQYTFMLTELDDIVATQTINHAGFDFWFNHQLDTFLNCTKTFKSGQRITSIKSNQYGKELYLTIKMIKEQCDALLAADYLKRLYEHHLKMVEFEANNPDTYVPTKSSKKKSTTRKRKQLSMDLGEEFSKPRKTKINNFPKIIVKIPGL